MAKPKTYADVLLPLPLTARYTYRVPEHLIKNLKPCRRVMVQFGKKKIYTALVTEVHDRKPDQQDVKDIIEVIDNKALIDSMQLSFWQWLSGYYLCSIGAVVNAALPGALKLQSESRVVAAGKEVNEMILDEKEQIILEALHRKQSMTIKDATDLVGDKKSIPLVKNMMDRGLITMEEEVLQKYKPRKESFVRLTNLYQDDPRLQEVFDQLGKRAFRQLQLLVSFINLSRGQNGLKKEIRRADLVKSVDASYQQLNQLVKKGVLEVYEKTVNRLESPSATVDTEEIVLNEQQSGALKEIKKHFSENKTVLLHGVTSSGKTEVYIKLIRDTLEAGKQVLYLLPEIALTTQIINRLRKYFGNKIGIFHSRYNEHEQVEVWNRVLNVQSKDHYPVILGARSAMFLPFPNLGLVIVDEEHDTSYKQYDPEPRYNARDSAVYLGGLHGADIILGSATPSFESYNNCHQGKFRLVEIKGRYRNIQLPEIHLVDLRKEPRIRQGKSNYSKALLDAIEKALKEKNQVMLFQNRRGFSLRMECNECQHTPMCLNCDISLTYHKQFKQLRCHYCGYHKNIPIECPSCGSKELFLKGFGTEKIEEELQLLFPRHRIRRMDFDTTRSRYAYQKIIQEFEQQQIDILVGTQMITKGLDFDHVSLVGIMSAEGMLNFPDFRSYERSYQLITQVSGRSGRKYRRGNVFIQTYDPYHMVIQYVLNNDFKGFYNLQMQDRMQFKYPPFYRLILLRLTHRDYRVLNRGAREFADDLRNQTGKTILGPEYPLVSKIKNRYRKHILIKAEKDPSLNELKKKILNRIELFHQLPENKSIRIQIDVDPL